MLEKEFASKYCPLAQGTCKGFMCTAWKKEKPGEGYCTIMLYYDMLMLPSHTVKKEE